MTTDGSLNALITLRGQPDAEVIRRLLAVADSRFQPALVKEAKAHGKLESGYVHGSHSEGTCWLMQWNEPPPVRICPDGRPTVSRSGNSFAIAATAAASLGPP